MPKPASENKSRIANKSGSLKTTLMRTFIILAILPMIVVAGMSYQKAYDSLFAAAKNQIKQSSQLKVRFIQNWFDYRFMDIEKQAIADTSIQLLGQLSSGFDNSSSDLAEYVKSYQWMLFVGEGENDLKTTKRIYDYVHDIFLIDTKGNVLYTVDRELDLGTNLYSGPYKNSTFTNSYSKVIETGQIIFSDIEKHVVIEEELTGFVIAPVVNDLGIKIGAIAIQLRMNKIYALLKSNLEQQTSSLTHYLVGNDGLLRSAIFDDEHILSHSIETDPFIKWAKSNRNSPDDLIRTYPGPEGDLVIGQHHTINLAGVNWVLFSEINLNEAVAKANKLGILTLIIILMTSFVVIIISYIVANNITRPLVAITKMSRELVTDSDTTEIRDRLSLIDDNNEIGTLSESINYMLLKNEHYTNNLTLSKEKIQKSLYEFSELQQAMDYHSIVVVTDKRGIIKSCNEKFCKISGYNEKEIIGQTHKIVHSNYHDKAFWQNFWKTISKGTIWQGNVCNRTKVGELYWVNSTIVPFLDEFGKPESYIAIRTDITDQIKAKSQLAEARENSEQANKAKSLFLANMSHEIRTPMNGVIGMTNLMLDEDLLPEQRTRALTVKHSAESLLAIINDILDFSKIEAGKLELEHINFDILELLEDFARTFAFQANEKLEFICPANPVEHCWYQGDPGRIRQIMTNLVSNAIKFTKSGEVSVHFDCDTSDSEQHILQFTVKDTGIGISKEQCEKLFNKFIQADSSTTRKFGGTGLGLAISKQLVELMAGNIDVHSKPDIGSSFVFTLKLSPISRTVAVETGDGLQQEKILIVDRDSTHRQFLQQLFDKWQISHSLVDNADQALVTLNTASRDGNPFSIALINTNEALVFGDSLAKSIKQQPDLADLKMFCITSLGTRGEAETKHDDGFTAYLCKPLKQSELYFVLSQTAILNIRRDHKIITSVSKNRSNDFPQFNARVLVVEDNVVNQKVAEGMLNKFGLSVDIAANGQEGLVALENYPYDLVFMDCQMPIMDGYEATSHVRDPKSNVLNHDIPIIAMTANAMKGDKEKCLNSGMNDFLSKPISVAKLSEFIVEWLDTKKTKT